MSSPSPIPPPNDRRSSRASSNASLTGDLSGLSDPEIIVGGPPNTPSPLALRAIHSPSATLRRKSRAKRVPPDMHMLDYVSPPDSNLTCPICQCAFDQPVQLACEHYFCRECVDRALEAQPRGLRSCPSCRREVKRGEEHLPVPKIITTMLDELQVRCPNTQAGCSWVDGRANVVNHVMLYCEYSLVECSATGCRQTVLLRDFHKSCLHSKVDCDGCGAPVMKRDLEDHQRNTCPQRTVVCPYCREEVLRLDLDDHITDTCPEYVMVCEGRVVGCKAIGVRAKMSEHMKSCPMATMAPFFHSQQARLERTEARIEPLTRKLSILEDGLSNITSMLFPPSTSTSTVNESMFPEPTDSAAFPQILTPDFRLPSAAFPPTTSSTTDPLQPPAPFDSSVHHLLSLHENLRDDVARLNSALSEHEVHTNMMVMAESQRAKEELKHANMAISQMRAQLHWLVSATLQQQRSANAAGSSTASSGAASGSSARSTQGASRPGPSGGAPATMLQVRRRLSDSMRQDTKL